MRKASAVLDGFFRFACVFALVMIGFAHTPASAYPNDALAFAYQLPDGTFAPLCQDDHDSSKPHAVKDTGCEACRLAAAILLPAPADVAHIEVFLSEEVKVFERRQRTGRALYPPNTGPRAPPAISMFT